MANGEPSGATGCDCPPPATTVNKVFDVGFDDWNEDVDKDPTSKELSSDSDEELLWIPSYSISLSYENVDLRLFWRSSFSF